MERTKMLLSTIATDAAETAGANGLGLEIAEFCTAFNFDQYFLETDRKIREEIRGIDHLTYHAPLMSYSRVQLIRKPGNWRDTAIIRRLTRGHIMELKRLLYIPDMRRIFTMTAGLKSSRSCSGRSSRA